MSTIDATVIRVDRGGFVAYVAGDDRVVAVGHRRGLEVRVGHVVELARGAVRVGGIAVRETSEKASRPDARRAYALGRVA